MKHNRDLAHLYRDLCEARDQLEASVSDAEFLSAQSRFEQVEAEWIALGEALGLTDGRD
jgi:hypothetical protein